MQKDVSSLMEYLDARWLTACSSHGELVTCDAFTFHSPVLVRSSLSSLVVESCCKRKPAASVLVTL